MIAVDTNILVYAHLEDSVFHEKAADCMARYAEGREPWAVPWPCVYEFFAIVTHARIYDPPSPFSAAMDQVDAWFESPSLVLLCEEGDYWATLKSIISASQVSGPMIHDARIAALCIYNGIFELHTADRDFNRFRDLVAVNPLIG